MFGKKCKYYRKNMKRGFYGLACNLILNKAE